MKSDIFLDNDHKGLSIFRQLLGVVIIISGLALEIMWLGVCFGSVILGFALLIFAPHILVLPWNACLMIGMSLLSDS